MKRLIVSLFAVAALTVMAGSAFADAPNGFVSSEFNLPIAPPGVFVDCLGEYVYGDRLVEARTRVLTTSTGTVHVVDKWKMTHYLTSTSGKVWVGQGVSPFVSSVRLAAGETTRWVLQVHEVPMDEGVPTLVYQNDYRLVLNAKGEVVVFEDEEPMSFRCLGPKK
jgi:hypothetical protein